MQGQNFKVGDHVLVKSNASIDDLEKVSDWGGEIEEIYEKEQLCIIALDAKTLNSLPNSYLLAAEEKGEDVTRYGFELSELQLAKRRDTPKSRRKALKKIEIRMSSLEEREVSVSSYNKVILKEGDDDKWASDFAKSKHFKQLTTEQQENGEFVARIFLDYMIRYGNDTPSTWTVADVLEVAAGVMPSKIAEDAAFLNKRRIS
jgi:hypothetical protein